jgi:hypothetical protein
MTRAISILLAISLVSNTVVQSTENKSLAYDRVAKYECLLDAPDGELWKRRALETASFGTELVQCHFILAVLGSLPSTIIDFNYPAFRSRTRCPRSMQSVGGVEVP